MNSRISVLLSMAAIVCGVLSGCGPSEDQVAMAKIYAARADRQPTYVESANYLQATRLNKHDHNYVMWAMEYSSLCMMNGSYTAAKDELLKAFDDIQTREDKNRTTRAALSNESLKLFKGEPFERAMVCSYLGLIQYMEKDYNNARIFLTQAGMADARTEENKAEYRNDFRLAHYLLGRTYLKLGDPTNANLAFKKASQRIPRKGEQKEFKRIQKRDAKSRVKRMKLEKQCFETASSGSNQIHGACDLSASPSSNESPEVLEDQLAIAARGNPVLISTSDKDKFFSPEFQKECNLIVVVETGRSPVKYLVGENQFMDKIIRAPYEEKQLLVYLNGHKAARAFPVLDMFHQADTRGFSDKDKAQIAKGITQSVLSRLPYVGSVASYWNVKADGRYWQLLAGEVQVFAAKVKPGLYTLDLQVFDSNGNLLPRYRTTRRFIPVVEGDETLVLLHTKYDSDNIYFPPEK